ncbi:MAG: hypothetical protein LBK99_13245 [Opitutaceae bacterium]|jgi:hypothetical protein|nr:hypothetical protein [Opitutaceae bacterium]
MMITNHRPDPPHRCHHRRRQRLVYCALTTALLSGLLAARTTNAHAHAQTATHAQPVENLLRRPEVRETGAYTYFARGDASRKNITPFTRMFYPGGGGGSGSAKPQGLHASTNGGPSTRDGELVDTGANAAPVPVRSGELTDGVTDTTRRATAPVSGWINVLSRGDVSEAGANTGQFDILFDLGAEYRVTKVVLWIHDQGGGHRWSGEQECYTASEFADPAKPADNDFRLFGSLTIPKGRSTPVEFVAASPASRTSRTSLTSRTARYVNLRLGASVSRRPGPTAAMGGILYEVEIHGFAP